MAKYQLQLHQLLDDGTDVPLYPINTALDVMIGKLSTGSLTLPGNASDETLAQTLANIKKYLTNLSNVAAASRAVDSSTTSASEVNLATSKAVNDLKVRIDGNDELLATHTTEISGKAPTSHAASALTYGGATGSLYGHVKLSDTYSTAVTNGTAQYSIGASQNALYNAYNALDNAKAPNNHAVSATTYGSATASLYGHVKLSDTYASKVSSGAAADGVGASQNALYNAYNALKTVTDGHTTDISGKAPTSHASTTASTYGAGNGTNYGHVKLSDSFDADNSSTGAAANSVAASSWAVYRAYSTLATTISTKLASTHASEKATASTFSHVKLSDSYTSSAGAASAGIGASSKGLYDCYAALNSRLVTAENNITTLTSRIKMAYQDFLPLSGGTIEGGQITIQNATEGVSRIRVRNGTSSTATNSGCLQTTLSSGNFGLYDDTNGRYIIYRDVNQDTVISASGSILLNTFAEIKKDTVFYSSIELNNGVRINGCYNNPSTAWEDPTLLILNSSNNIHIGDYHSTGEACYGQVYLHFVGNELQFVETSVRPKDDNELSLGNKNHRWKQLYAGTTTISTSDRNLKNHIKDIDRKKLQLMLNILPREFMFNNGDRVHTGIIAQELEEEMNKLHISSEELAILCKDIIYEYDHNEDGTEIESSKKPIRDSNGNIECRYGARYEEMITPILKLVQILWKKVFGSLEITDDILSILQDI